MHRLVFAFALALFAIATLAACNRVPRTMMVHRSSVDGETSIEVRTEIVRDQATFRCVSSRTGQCRIALYARTCRVDVSLREGRVDEQCTVRSLATLEINRGGEKAVQGLPPDFRLCAAPDAMPVAPACAMQADGGRG